MRMTCSEYQLVRRRTADAYAAGAAEARHGRGGADTEAEARLGVSARENRRYVTNELCRAVSRVGAQLVSEDVARQSQLRTQRHVLLALVQDPALLVNPDDGRVRGATQVCAALAHLLQAHRLNHGRLYAFGVRQLYRIFVVLRYLMRVGLIAEVLKWGGLLATQMTVLLAALRTTLSWEAVGAGLKSLVAGGGTKTAALIMQYLTTTPLALPAIAGLCTCAVVLASPPQQSSANAANATNDVTWHSALYSAYYLTLAWNNLLVTNKAIDECNAIIDRGLTREQLDVLRKNLQRHHDVDRLVAELLARCDEDRRPRAEEGAPDPLLARTEYTSFRRIVHGEQAARAHRLSNRVLHRLGLSSVVPTSEANVAQLRRLVAIVEKPGSLGDRKVLRRALLQDCPRVLRAYHLFDHEGRARTGREILAAILLFYQRDTDDLGTMLRGTPIVRLASAGSSAAASAAAAAAASPPTPAAAPPSGGASRRTRSARSRRGRRGAAATSSRRPGRRSSRASGARGRRTRRLRRFARGGPRTPGPPGGAGADARRAARTRRR